MKLTYDDEADAAYVYLRDQDAEIPPKVAKTISCNEPFIKRLINLDFDSDGRLIGIEVLHAQSVLPTQLFE